MTAAPAPTTIASLRFRRLQTSLVVLALVAAVALTVVLVARPGASVAGTTTSAGAGTALLPGTRVEVRGGDAFSAYRLADRLAASGAVLGRIAPAGAGDAGVGATGDDGTTIVYYERRQLAVAEGIRRLVGGGTLQRSEVFQPVVDVTIVLGKDLSRA
jgi:hypothetical protein